MGLLKRGRWRKISFFSMPTEGFSVLDFLIGKMSSVNVECEKNESTS